MHTENWVMPAHSASCSFTVPIRVYKAAHDDKVEQPAVLILNQIEFTPCCNLPWSAQQLVPPQCLKRLSSLYVLTGSDIHLQLQGLGCDCLYCQARRLLIVGIGAVHSWAVTRLQDIRHCMVHLVMQSSMKIWACKC